MTQEFALRLTDLRLRQVSRLLEWMIRNHPDSDALIPALAAVNTAHETVKGRLPGAA